jgi:competence protein ComEC
MDHLQVVAPQRTKLVGNIGVKGFGASAVSRGDTVKVTGKLYLTRGNNLASIGFATLEVVKSKPSLLENIRHRFIAGMQSALPEPQASFGLGLLIGQRSTLPEDAKNQLMMVGLTHIIAVSGYNLTIIVDVVRRRLGKLSKFQNTAMCLSLMGIFLLIAGSSPPIVRASIISMLSIWAWYYGRTIKPLVLILVGAAITVLANPLYIWGNVSWYLSFLAFFGVLVLSPLISRRIFAHKKPGLLVQVLLESLCASVMTIPYILYIFGQVSLVALVANVLVVPFIPLAMLLSLLAGLAGAVIPALAGWIALPAKFLLTYMLDVASVLSRLPHAFVENVYLSALAMFFIYSVVAVLCWTLWRKLRKSDKITDEYSW